MDLEGHRITCMKAGTQDTKQYSLTNRVVLYKFLLSGASAALVKGCMDKQRSS